MQYITVCLSLLHQFSMSKELLKTYEKKSFLLNFDTIIYYLHEGRKIKILSYNVLSHYYSALINVPEKSLCSL